MGLEADVGQVRHQPVERAGEEPAKHVRPVVSGRRGERAGRHGACAKTVGVELIAVGIRDLILPGEMKDLMNKVTEAKKATRPLLAGATVATLIARREETAAMRSQANAAKLLAGNPTLMRLRELEVLEKAAANGRSDRLCVLSFA
jgi:regulator of protease activity HflC (stomatin/prohibitin superfamily)